ncbi:Hsp70 family protein [Candidatus Mycobacterium wuenschmannii]|uniref:Hsp70 family protein n=1 Tax=Candidatus Mycobacterium wuenschmannii TaxID=3027808 RepID=A0ABY8VTZ9_9MYCO|nr:Hsp70 family protein [Candidatus Mycobacterium wuenschmannii]WIM87109.1 Hsp70 family protein [Candidatus Mycobacterium wuenschmannii]
MSRRAVLTVFPDRAPELGVPEDNPDDEDTGTLMTGFVEQIGGSKTLKSADGSVHDPSLLLVEALDALIAEAGGEAATSNITMAVPAHWGTEALRGMQEALNTHPEFVHGGIAPRLVPDSVAALTALNSDSRLPAKGVVALLDFGGGGTSITLADAASDFTPIADTLRYQDFSGDLLDEALMAHALDNAGRSLDPTGTAVAGQFAGLREECRLAKERLSIADTTELALDLPGRRARLEISRAEFDDLIEERLDGLFTAFDDMLRRNRIRSKDLAAVAMAGGTAKIPVVAQRVSSHTKASVITAMQPGLATAVGAVKLSARQPVEQRDGEREETTMSTLVGASTGGFATITSGVATTGRSIAPTDALGTSTGTFGASTGTFDIPTAGALFDDPSERLTELAWSQADDADDEPVVYTGEPYDTDEDRSTPSQLLQVPRYAPVEPVRTRGRRLPQLFLGLAALVSMIAIGGVAFTLTGSDHAPTVPSSTPAPPPPPVSSQLPSPSLAPPPSSEAPPPPPPPTEAPPPPPPVQTVTETYTPPPPPKPTQQATTTVPQPTTTTPQVASTTPSTTPPPPPPPSSSTPSQPAMTTTYLNLPFVPVPIPVQVPEGQQPQQPQNQYPQQNPYQQGPYQQNPYQQSPYGPQYSYPNPGYGY